MRIFILFLLLLPLVAPAEDELSQRQAELKALQQKILAISSRIDQDQAEKDSLGQQLQRSEKRLAGLRHALRLARRDLDQARQTSKQLQAELSEQRQQLNQDLNQLKRQLRRSFMLGRQAATRMMLSQDDPARLARLQTYLEYLQRQQSRGIESAVRSLDALQQKQGEADTALGRLKALEQSRQQALKAIDVQRDKRAAALAKVEQRLRHQGRSIAQLREQQQRLEKLVDALQNAASRHGFRPPKGAFGKLKGQLLRPVSGRQLASFQQRKADGQNRWNGLWLAADSGNPVHAVADARVVYVGWMHHFGLLIVLDHGDGYFSLYGHNQSAQVQVGDQISGGTPIAEAGNTGGHSESGVYLEIRKGRNPLNPAKWLRPRSS